MLYKTIRQCDDELRAILSRTSLVHSWYVSHDNR